MTDLPASPAALRRERDVTIDRLCEHFAADHIPADRLERLIDRAHEAKSSDELQALLSDLPAIPHPAVAPAHAQAPGRHIELHQTVVAIMGGAERKGSWSPARMTRVLSLMGGAVLDFRTVRLPPGVTEVQIFAVMGGAEVIVPPGMLVATEGIGIMGGFDHVASGASQEVPPDAPMLRITGFAFMGGVEITERLPGESAKEARKRLKREAREGRVIG
jgi:hypothetical protein